MSFPYKTTYSCVIPICTTGIKPSQCSPIKIISDPNEFSKEVIYDLNLNDPFSKDVYLYYQSTNIGSKMVQIHNAEMDFADRNVKIGGLILGRYYNGITWYLMTERNFPRLACSYDSFCLLTKKTVGGLIDFNYQQMKNNQIFYICAESSAFQLCSNGFLVDNSAPTGGIVFVETYNGYVIDCTKLTIRWTGFMGNTNAKKLGYMSDIEGYRYAVGK